MTRSDVGTIILIYATCILFFYMTLQLKAAAQIYPLCLIGGLALLNTLYLGKCALKLARSGEKPRRPFNDLPEIFKGFQPGQFFFIVGACLLYMVLLFYIGFYPAGFIYLVGVMLFLRVKPLNICITVGCLGILVYGVFTMFLKVPLPKGFLFS